MVALCCCNLGMIICTAVVIGYCNVIAELQQVNLTHIDQIRYDWAEIPWTSFDVRSVSEGCREEEFYVWYKDWGGTELGCYTSPYSEWGESLETYAEYERS